MKKTKTMTAALLILMIMVLSACGGNNAPANNAAATDSPATTAPAETANAGSGGESTDAPQEEVTIRLGLVGGGMTPIISQIGINDGSFEQAGIKIEMQSFNSGADMVQALVGGSLDVVLGSYEHVLRQQKNGLGVKAYGEIYNGVGYTLLVKKDSEYQTLEDLKGATLAVTKVGSLSDTGLREGLKEANIDPEKEVQIINGGSGATMLAAIESGKVAGGMVSEPNISQMLATGDYRVLYDPPFDYAGIIIMAKTDWVGKNEDAMRRFLAVNNEINERAQADPASAVTAMLKEFDQVPQEVMESAVKNQLAKVPAGLVLSEEGAAIVQKTQLDQGILTEEIPFDQTVDLSLLP
ncbi:ABC transporter substrate-binding protein [Paenibacillus sp. S150]|uniref:ABC transporter substrate-binding protein n=1 Tax=Paenibacillus sp. S150 TaxID=2749826 RepID=UPI001C596F41|nr:ABC transporter substrate-binding protein [Paenibacillus sp. S150]MBW4084571.1 ABC transporter substrate-binding protein [Paenibacillus sp. S150]